MLQLWLFGPAAINSGMLSQTDWFYFCKHQEILKEHFWEQHSKCHYTGSRT